MYLLTLALCENRVPNNCWFYRFMCRTSCFQKTIKRVKQNKFFKGKVFRLEIGFFSLDQIWDKHPLHNAQNSSGFLKFSSQHCYRITLSIFQILLYVLMRVIVKLYLLEVMRVTHNS